MSKDNNALEEQLERIQTEINETVDPERLKFIATEMVSTFKYLADRFPYLSAGILMIPHQLSNITEEPEECQGRSRRSWGDKCENWALAGEFFCEDHVE